MREHLKPATSFPFRAAAGVRRAAVREGVNAPGRPLDAFTRQQLESRFDRDFSAVRVHTDARAAASARQLGAKAYTVGRDVVFGAGRYAPGTEAGRHLIAHELAHVAQQRNASHPGEPRVADPNGAAEREAEHAARSVAAGAGAPPLRAHGVALQRQPDYEAKKKGGEKDDEKGAGETIAEGLKTVAEQAVDNNPKVKTTIVEPIKEKAKGEWNRLGTGEKIGVVSFGAATVAGVGGAMLSDPSGRRHLEGVNLAAPLQLIPYLPLTRFKYTLPSGEGAAARQLRFDTAFSGDELLEPLTARLGLPKMTLKVDMGWNWDVASERLSIGTANASIGLMPGVTLSGGRYPDILRPPQRFPTAEGGQVELRKTFPEPAKPEAIPDTRILLTVDLLKLDEAIIGRRLSRILKSF